jgi:hypothetical protein
MQFTRNTPFCSDMSSPFDTQKYLRGRCGQHTCPSVYDGGEAHPWASNVRSIFSIRCAMFSYFIPFVSAWKSYSLYLRPQVSPLTHYLTQHTHCTSAHWRPTAKSRYAHVTLPSFPCCSAKFTIVCRRVSVARAHSRVVEVAHVGPVERDDLLEVAAHRAHLLLAGSIRGDHRRRLQAQPGLRPVKRHCVPSASDEGAR